tara:strand:- start:17855 stop:18322 length:468 start_codon:yes stop_codon:yes gene_type:complete
MDINDIPDTEEVLNQASQTISNTKNFIFGNVAIIFALSLLLMALVIIFTVLDISFKENDMITSDVYILEGNTNLKKYRKEKCTSDVNEVEKLCEKKGVGELAKKKCMKYECCIWPEYKDKKNKPRCVAGDKTGPSISTSKLGYDEFYYMNKKYKI